MIRAACLQCHSATLAGAARSGAPDGINFDTEGDVQRHIDHIRLLALVDLLMPPTRPLAACNRNVLSSYLDQLASGPCIPGCSGRVCGDDGCAGSCGTCAPGLTCDPNGQCTAAAP